MLKILRHAYPEGRLGKDYWPLLAALHADPTDENLALLVAELIGGEAVIVDNDAAAAVGRTAGACLGAALDSGQNRISRLLLMC
ncbi:DUF3349 domain-containing protein [Micromonospora foliorum]|uniref:DUF3349 domain-containing protein n=1 Tax=Micromonospora foliorum TaxID=2911210 RepID=UPI001EE8A3A5|nr:DUF3349 domain-containing protein [Micromonospora foliorum]MCG5434580.1 DUF3349 domain-containing protein [Micromonospora foliorum]